MSIEQELIEQKLFELLESSSFDELSKEESEFVLRQMSKEQYEEQHLSIMKVTELESEEQYEFQPSPAVETELFKETNKRSILTLFWQVFTTKISLGYALPVVLFFTFFLFKGSQEEVLKTDHYSGSSQEEYVENNSLNNSIDTLITVIRDTIYLEKSISELEVIPEKVAYHDHTNRSKVEEGLAMSVATVQESKNGTASGLSANDNPYTDFVPPVYRF